MASLEKAYAASGWKGSLERGLSMRKEQAQKGYVEPYRLAELYVALGEKKQALLWLERAYESRSS